VCNVGWHGLMFTDFSINFVFIVIVMILVNINDKLLLCRIRISLSGVLIKLCSNTSFISLITSVNKTTILNRK